MMVASFGHGDLAGLAERGDVAVLDQQRLIGASGGAGAIDHARVGQRHDRGIDGKRRGGRQSQSCGGCAASRTPNRRRRRRTTRVGSSIFLNGFYRNCRGGQQPRAENVIKLEHVPKHQDPVQLRSSRDATRRFAPPRCSSCGS